MHEASLYKQNSFITLTYNDANKPPRGQLIYADYQNFMRRLRKEFPQKIRFYMCGEYGPELSRPHFHACLFNCDFVDKTIWNENQSGQPVYRSQTLEKLWPQGYSLIGDVTFESAAYIARYCIKKITGFNARYWYVREDQDGTYRLNPEFNKMSLKPGIGGAFLEKWQKDIYPNDKVVLRGGLMMKPPKYYDKKYKRENEEEYERIKYEREMNARANYKDNTNERLKTKEIVTEAKIKNLKRQLS